MNRPTVVCVSDAHVLVGDREVPRPAGLRAGRFEQQMAVWLGPHEDTHDLDERRARRESVSPEFLQEFGQALFEALFGGGLREAYSTSGNAVIALHLPEDLRQLPWELMHDGDLWVAQARGVVRVLEGHERCQTSVSSGALRVLGLLAMPVLNPLLLPGDSDQPYVGDVEKHAEIFRKLEGKDWFAAFRVVRHATPDDLREGLEEGAEVLYFLGHGSAEGVCFDDGSGRVRRVDRFTLRQRLHGSGVRVAVANSCLTAAHMEGEDPVAGMLVRAGVPVVVGMEVPISEAAAQRFAEAFLGSLARGRSAIQAVASARAAVQDAHNLAAIGNERWEQVQAWEWATPVVYVSDKGLDAAYESASERVKGSAVVRDVTGERLREARGLPQRPARFVGRRQELVDTADSLEQTPVTILHGIRGVGKTTLALEAAHRAARRFERIVWVRARVEGPADALSGASADPMVSGRLVEPGDLISRPAWGLGVSEELGGEEMLAAIGREADRRRTLLVLDNLDSFAEKGPFAGLPVLRDLLAALRKSTRALLTVAGNLEVAGRRIHVPGLPPDMAAILAYEYGQEMAVGISGEEAWVIGTSTGGHPMAIRFAVGLIGRGKVARGEIIDGLRGKTGEPVDEVLGYVMGRAVEAASDDARLVFTLASQFPSPMLREVLEAGTLWEDRERFNQALAEAAELILVEPILDGGYVLIQELQRARAARLGGQLPSGAEHGRAMVEWARKQGDEILFCDLVAAWEVYCSRHGHLAIWEPAGRQAVTWAAKIGDTRREMVARNDLGVWCVPTGNLAEGLEHFRRCARLARKQKDAEAQAAALGNMGSIYMLQGKLERALECYQKAYEIGERLGDQQAMAGALSNMGLIHADRGDLERALECYQKAYEIAERLGDQQVMASALGNMGLIYADRGDLERALECHQKAYEIAERLGNQQTMANQLGNMGLIYQQQGDLERALECYQKAYEIAERLGSQQTIANQLGNMGNIYMQQGDLERALECYQKAYEIAERLGNPETMANQLGNMGNVYMLQGDLERALECYQKAYEIAERLGSPQTMANQLGNMGLVYAQQGELGKAREHLERARDVFERMGVKGQGPEAVARALAALDEMERGKEQT